MAKLMKQIVGTMFELLLLALLGRELVIASSILRSQEGNGTVPSAASLAGCQTSCGNLTFEYPFGIGPGCSRGPDFELTCNESAQSPRLLLRDGITQVAYNIITTDMGSYRDNVEIGIALTYTIPMRYGVDVYNISWNTPGKSFALSYAYLNVTGCDFDIYFVDRSTNSNSRVCTLTCASGEITDMVALQNCNGTGCCSLILGTTPRAFELSFVLHNKSSVVTVSNRSSLWDYINVTTDRSGLQWKIVNQPSCANFKEDNTSFACIANNSRCLDDGDSLDFGYFCKCNPGYVGNPYLLNGCVPDTGYNPTAQQKANCSRRCGTINVPFPFGIEEGCSARKQFYLNCTKPTASNLLLGDSYLVTGIDIEEGLIKFRLSNQYKGSIEHISGDDDSGSFVRSGETASLKWAVANLTCSEAKANTTGYACVSTSSTCLAVNSTDGYVGYRCQCYPRYVVNPYLLNGCVPDTGYNPTGQQKANCSRRCGTINVPFPFGIEEGCSARKQFYLNCTKATASNLLLGDSYLVTGIDIEEGLIKFRLPDQYERSIEHISGDDDPGIFVRSGETASLKWAVANLTCSEAKANTTGYACVSTSSTCLAVNSTDGYVGYRCQCYPGFVGNPYLLNGCVPDTDYNPTAQQKANCSRRCGTINVPFPFGIEDGCSARKQFYLNCTKANASNLLLGDIYLVTGIDIEEGLIRFRIPDQYNGSIEQLSRDDDSGIFVRSGETASLKWVVANLTCSEAQANMTGYACVSTRSICLAVNSTDGYGGYRCQCSYGFEGNPYVQSGCQDLDECSLPNRCNGPCRNTLGGFNCTKCPPKTIYDPIKLQCSPVKQQNVLVGIVIGLSSGFTVLFLTASGIYLTRRWKRNVQKRLRNMYFRRNQGLLLEQLILSDENASDKTKIFSLEELEKATNNFDSTRIVGRGGHGMVYKGILSDKNVVAIKRSKFIEEGEINQFINEVAILSQINHRNIVKLFGCCLETEVPLLVYDFISNGSLYELLHAYSSNESLLSWDGGLRIAAEAAGALCYLHSAASVSVFHRDVKSSNILLDSNYTAKVSDFGASRLVPINQTHVVTNVQGTFGYLDPEYYHTGQLNEKSDVYSFGVVLLELLVRKEPIFTSESGAKQNLANYFLMEMKARAIREIVAPQVLDEASEEEINCLASLVQNCVRLQGDHRPTMKQVEMALQFLRAKRTETNDDSVQKDEERQILRTKEV